MEYINKYVSFQEGPGVRKNQYTQNGIKLLNVANLVDGKLDLSTSKRYISESEARTKYKHFLVDEGDLVIASSGIKVEYFDKKMGFVEREHLPLCMNTSTIRFKSISNDIDIKYFMYFLKSQEFKKQLNKLITGSAQLNFGPSHLNKVKINLPSISEQKELSVKLDKIQDIINIRKKQIKDFDNIIKSRFIEMIGDPHTNPHNWLKAPMGDFIIILTDFSANGSYEYLDSNVVMYDEPNYALMVRTTDLEKQDFENDVKYIDKNAYNILKKSKILGNELIMNKIGSAGKVYLMPCLNRPVSLGRNAFMFRFNESINVNFIYNLLTSEYGTNEIMQHVRGAVTKTITKDATRSIKIIVPPIDIQDQFAAFIQQVNKQKFELQESLITIGKLQESIMNKYFN